MNTKIYQVGGSVRDEILGVKSKDIDYAVESESYISMKDYIINSGGKIYLESPEFFTIRGRIGEIDADYVLCRKDGAYSDGRRPDSVEVGTIYDDLARRDFTMNAIAKDSEGNYIDPFDGRKDIAEKIIRCVGNTEQRISEDYLRLLRAARFSIVKGMSIDKSILQLFDNTFMTSKLSIAVSKERIREELYKMFKADTIATVYFFGKYPKMSYACFSDDLWLKPTMESK